jgi:hypothetical protein
MNKDSIPSEHDIPSIKDAIPVDALDFEQALSMAQATVESDRANKDAELFKLAGIETSQSSGQLSGSLKRAREDVNSLTGEALEAEIYARRDKIRAAHEAVTKATNSANQKSAA